MSRGLKKLAVTLVRVGVSAALIYLIISRIGFREILGNVRILDPFAFILVLVLFAVSILIMTLRWRLFIPGTISVRELFNITYIGTFFNTCLPGSVGGDIVKVYYLSRMLKDSQGGKGAPDKGGLGQRVAPGGRGHNVTAFGSAVLDRYVGLVTLLVIGILATLLGSKYFSSHPVRWLIPVLLALVALVSGVVLKLRVFRSFSVVSEIYAYMDEVAFRKKEILTAFLYSLATQTIMICNVYILARGLSMHAPFVSVLCFVPVVSIISLIPVTISGIGLREGAFVVLFGLIGIVPDKAMTLSIIWFISIVAGSLPGLIIYLLHHKTLLKAFPEQA
ncbi:MAG: flippase-like domain-containing protein [Syntrophorhabdus sp.]|nr:flippase-like domain-containing protein [Syntrophorhabdus sp.]